MEINEILVIIGFVVLLLLEGLFEIAFFSLVGASIRWVTFRKKKFMEYYRDKVKINSIIGLGLFISLFFLFLGIIKLIAI